MLVELEYSCMQKFACPNILLEFIIIKVYLKNDHIFFLIIYYLVIVAFVFFFFFFFLLVVVF